MPLWRCRQSARAHLPRSGCQRCQQSKLSVPPPRPFWEVVCEQFTCLPACRHASQYPECERQRTRATQASPLHLSHIPALHSLNEPHPSHHSRTMANLQSDEQLDPIALGCEYETNRISGKEGGRRSKKRAYSGLTHSTGGVCGKEPKNLTDTAIVASRCSTA